jgi:GTP 3',8-cyclase
MPSWAAAGGLSAAWLVAGTRARTCCAAPMGGERSCLFAGTGHDLRGPLRAGASDQALREHVTAIWTRRADRYSELRTRQTGRKKVSRKVEMSHIGS